MGGTQVLGERALEVASKFGQIIKLILRNEVTCEVTVNTSARWAKALTVTSRVTSLGNFTW